MMTRPRTNALCWLIAAAAQAQLEQAQRRFSELVKALERGDRAEDRHGCVRQKLEAQNLKAIQALRPKKKADEPDGDR